MVWFRVGKFFDGCNDVTDFLFICWRSSMRGLVVRFSDLSGFAGGFSSFFSRSRGVPINKLRNKFFYRKLAGKCAKAPEFEGFPWETKGPSNSDGPQSIIE